MDQNLQQQGRKLSNLAEQYDAKRQKVDPEISLLSEEIKDAAQHIEGQMDLSRLQNDVNHSSRSFKVQEDSVYNDGFSWRKYGQKLIRNHRFPKLYFGCATRNCRAVKLVEQCDEDDSQYLVTYMRHHTCQPSASKVSSDSRTGTVSNIMEERDAGKSHGEYLSESFSLTSNPLDKFTTDLLDQHERFHAEGSISLQSEQLPVESVGIPSPRTPSPSSIGPPTEHIQKPEGIQLLLTLENMRLGESIFVGALCHAAPSEIVEFYFFNAKDMAICVGVGLPQAKVILHNDLSITIEETTVSERELKDTWTPFLSEERSHVVMKVEMDAADMRANRDDHVQTVVTEKGKMLSRLHGVGFDCHSHCINETYHAAEVSWPLLYDMALFILTANDVQCNETYEKSSAQGSGGSSSKIVDKLHEKRDNVFKRGNFQDGEGDGDEDCNSNAPDDEGCNSNAPDNDDPPVVLKVTVYPLTKFDILGLEAKPYGLEGASIAPKLVFEFRQNRECKRISIKTQTRLELVSQMDVFFNTQMFGWYHTGIQISFGCEDTQGHPESGRVALLKQNSCRILNAKTCYKYTTAKSIMSSKADTYTTGSQAGFKLSSALLGGIALQGSSSGSKTQQVASSSGRNVEPICESICGGFYVTDWSSTELPARASFLLHYPLQKMSIWEDREFLQGQGLFSTIEPSIEGTWIPLNGLDASPYLFKVTRLLNFHARVAGMKDHVLDHKQEYLLPFYVNHAMSHLKSQRSNHIELSGDQQSVPNVLEVGSVY